MKGSTIHRDVAARVARAWVESVSGSIAEIVDKIQSMSRAIEAAYDTPYVRKYERNRKKAVARSRRNNANRRRKK